MQAAHEMYKEIRKKAGSLGANAIILDSLSEPTAGDKIVNAIIGTPNTRKGKAIAIYVFEEGSVGAAP